MNVSSILEKRITSKNMTCAEALVQALVEKNVDSIFGYPGASVLSIYNELSKIHKIKHYLVRHEQAAIHAAEGYSRVSGKPGVVLVTSGPGVTNTITGIANAYSDSTPLIVLAGDVAGNKGKIFQKVDIESLTKSCAKKIFCVSPKDDIKKIIDDAFQIAMSDSKGPVVIVLPRNIIESKYTKFKCFSEFNLKKDHNYQKEIYRLKEIIQSAKKPLVLVGGGAVNASNEVNSFVSQIKAPVVSTLMGIGIYPSSKRDYIGMIGLNGTNVANSILRQADLLISLGVSFSDRSTCKNFNFGKNIKVISMGKGIGKLKSALLCALLIYFN